MHLKVVKEDGQDALPGEIVCRGETIMKGYWQLPEQSAEKLKGGWLYTEDLGKVSEDGYVYLVDRKHDMIITGGINVYPREVEEVLYPIPASFGS